MADSNERSSRDDLNQGSDEHDQYVARETLVNRVAQIIVKAECKPYAAAEALITVGLIRLPPSPQTMRAWQKLLDGSDNYNPDEDEDLDGDEE